MSSHRWRQKPPPQNPLPHAGRTGLERRDSARRPPSPPLRCLACKVSIAWMQHALSDVMAPAARCTTSTREPFKCTREPSPRHLSRQKPYHMHLRAITAAFVKTTTLPHAPASHHRGICRDPTTSTRVTSPPAFVKTKTFYRMHPRAITAAFVKTKTLPHAPASHHRGICQDKSLIPLAPASHHRGICQDNNLTTCTREPSPRHLSRPYHERRRAIVATFANIENISASIREASNRTRSRRIPITTLCTQTTGGFSQSSHASAKLARYVLQSARIPCSLRCQVSEKNG